MRSDDKVSPKFVTNNLLHVASLLAGVPLMTPGSDLHVATIEDLTCRAGQCTKPGDTMLELVNMFGSVRCVSPDKCVFNGEDQQRMMSIDRTGKQKLTLSRFIFLNGRHKITGGALSIYDFSVVTIELCQFVNNYSGGRGGAIYLHLSRVDIYGTVFNDNNSFQNTDNAIYRYTDVDADNDEILPPEVDSVEVFGTCPPPYEEEAPERGEMLIANGMTRIPYSYSKCEFSACPKGKYNSNGGSDPEVSCVDCRPGWYNDNDLEGNFLRSCEACPKGKFSVDPTSCLQCSRGKVSTLTGATSCSVCPNEETTDDQSSCAVKSCPSGQINDGDGVCKECKKAGEFGQGAKRQQSDSKATAKSSYCLLT